MALRIALFLIMVVAVWGGGHYYLGRRLVVGSNLSRRAAVVSWGVLGALALLPLWVLVGGRVGAPASEVVKVAGFVALGFSALMLTFALSVDLVGGVRRALSRLSPPRRDDVNPGRRLFLQRTLNAGIAGGSAGLTVAGYRAAVTLPDVVHVKVPVEGLPRALEGFRIVQLTDIHVGPTIHRAYLQGLVDLANAEAPDLVAVTGDLVDGFVDGLRHEVAPLQELKARHGAYFVTGNHEYYWDGPAWCAHVESLGLTVLQNEHRTVEHDGTTVVVAGINDHRASQQATGHASDPAAAVAGAPDGFRIMLAHQPRSVPGVLKAGADLTLCGHTHGGQFFPMNLLVHLFQPWVAGLHRLVGSGPDPMWLYVSRGAGYWGPPNRLGAPSEVTVLELVRA